MLTIALSHLLARGVRVEAYEAVALAREILAHPGGVPTLENIQLGSDGSVCCISTEGMPSVASVAALLETLLPDGTPNVPAPLRYAIARALETVEAPRFASLLDFANALDRFERGSSRDVLRGLLDRVIRPSIPTATAAPVAPRPVTPAASRPSPATPTLAVVPRPTLVMRKRVESSSVPLEPDAAAPPMLKGVGRTAAESSPVQSLRWSRWAVPAAAALVVSFAVGFVAGDAITHRHAGTNPSGFARVSHALATTAFTVKDSAANPADVRTTQRTPGTPEAAVEARDRSTPRNSPTTPMSERPVRDLERVPDPVRSVRAIDGTNANAFSPAFAPDGTTIFFHTGRDSDARSAIEAATAGEPPSRGLGVIPVVDDGWHNYHAQPSPDGRFVAFDSDRDGERGVYVANRDGSEVRRISGSGYAAVPTWSRNNKWLAYIRAETGKPSVWNLWLQPAAGGSARRVTNYPYGQTWAASWFPDDRHIAYSHEATLVVFDLQTGQAKHYQTPVKGQLVRTPAVSPDGTKIIFQVFRHGAWLLNLADRSMRRVLTDATAEEFAWSPDGRRIAFHSRRDGRWGIYVLSES
ncbi:MAG TPA: hypothetical protein VL484_00235 [Vicinamibacterales bacterium]|nr:hypothetical protein [Vicinamibacterales bacterium]